jgi:hypothetical protein
MKVANVLMKGRLVVETKRGRGGARSGSGPKPKPVKELHRNRIMLNLTDEEYAALRRLASKERPAAFARKVLARYLARRKK